MPIYEFLCPNCNRVYSFLSQSYNPTKTPKCPKCSSENMTKQISRFSFIRAAAGGKSSGPHDQAEPSDFGGPGGPGGFGGPGGPGGFGGPGGPGGPGGYGGQGEGGPDPFDDPRVEREMMRLMSQAEHLDENDPRQLGAFMRRMTEIAGEDMEPEMEEAIRRLEAGEDPEKIEEDLGDAFGDGDPTGMGMGGMGAPSYDDGLYSM